MTFPTHGVYKGGFLKTRDRSKLWDINTNFLLVIDIYDIPPIFSLWEYSHLFIKYMTLRYFSCTQIWVTKLQWLKGIEWIQNSIWYWQLKQFLRLIYSFWKNSPNLFIHWKRVNKSTDNLVFQLSLYRKSQWEIIFLYYLVEINGTFI